MAVKQSQGGNRNRRTRHHRFRHSRNTHRTSRARYRPTFTLGCQHGSNQNCLPSKEERSLIMADKALGVLIAIVGLAGIAVIVSKRSNTAAVLTAALNGFSNGVKAAVSPVTK